MPRYKFPKGNKINLGRKQSEKEKKKRGEIIKRLWKEGKIKGTTGKTWKRGQNINCVICKKLFYVKPGYKKYNTRFCSRKCKGIWMKDFIPWNKGLKGLQPWHNISGLKTGTCWKGQKRPSMTGKNHPCWVNGNYKKQDKRNDSAYQNWVKQVKKRDKNICKLKDDNCFGYNIVHHIKGWKLYPELRYEINNGITLCLAHHPRKRAEEKRLIPFFQGLVSVSN